MSEQPDLARMDISSYISELLYSHNCVIIPGFGGFVASYRPAASDANKHTYYPPSKHIAFNENLRTNDGLLAHHISLRENISFEQALSRIDAFISLLRESLSVQKKASLPDIGAFSMSKGRLVFEPSQHNFLTDSFGLSPVQAIPVKRSSTEQDENRNVRQLPSRFSPGKVAAVIALLIMTGSGLFLLNLDDKNPFANRTELNPFADTFDAADTPAEAPAVTKPRDTVVFRSQFNPKKKPAILADTVKTSYHIIGGAFQQSKNAEKYIMELKKEGIDAFLMPGKTEQELYRVSLGKFTERSEAVTRLQEIKDHINPEAWILTL